MFWKKKKLITGSLTMPNLNIVIEIFDKFDYSYYFSASPENRRRRNRWWSIITFLYLSFLFLAYYLDKKLNLNKHLGAQIFYYATFILLAYLSFGKLYHIKLGKWGLLFPDEFSGGFKSMHGYRFLQITKELKKKGCLTNEFLSKLKSDCQYHLKINRSFGLGEVQAWLSVATAIGALLSASSFKFVRIKFMAYQKLGEVDKLFIVLTLYLALIMLASWKKDKGKKFKVKSIRKYITYWLRTSPERLSKILDQNPEMMK